MAVTIGEQRRVLEDVRKRVDALSHDEWMAKLYEIADKYESGEIVLGYDDERATCLYSSSDNPNLMCGVGALMTDEERLVMRGCGLTVEDGRPRVLQCVHDCNAPQGTEAVVLAIRRIGDSLKAYKS